MKMSDQTVTCPKCSKQFLNQHGLKIHIGKMHKKPTIVFKSEPDLSVIFEKEKKACFSL